MSNINNGESKLNLHKATVNYHFRSLDPKFMEILTAMEKLETWTVDNTEDVNAQLIEFGKKLSQYKNLQILKENTQDFITLLGYISSPRTIRMINWIDQNLSSFSMVILIYSKNNQRNDVCKLMTDRLNTLKTLSMLGFIFSETRVKSISTLMEHWAREKENNNNEEEEEEEDD